MERIFRIFSKEYGNINQAALLLGLFSLISQLLGLFRDRSLAHFLGPSKALDIYYAAFRVPDFIFISIASLASVTVLVPFVLHKMGKDSELNSEANTFLNNVFMCFVGLLIGVAIIAFVFMPVLVKLVAPGFEISDQNSVINLSRILLLSPILLGVSNLFGSVTQIFRKFFSYALSPIFYNVGIISGVVLLYPIYGTLGIVIGVVIGAFLHFLIQYFASLRCGFVPVLQLRINLKEIKEVIMISLPRTLGLALNSISILFIVSFASYLESGSISIFNFAYNLQTTPLGIIGLSYAVAAFPTLSKSFSVGNIDDFKDYLRSASRAIIFWSLPVAFLFIVLRAQIVRVVLGTGLFSWENTRLVAASLAIFSLSIVAQGLIALFARAYYASGNTKKPLYVNLFSSIFIVIFSYLFLSVWESYPLFRYFIESLLKVNGIVGAKVLMLPLAYSMGTLLNFILLWIFIKKDFMKKELFIMKSFFQNLSSAFIIGFVSYVSLSFFSSIFDINTFWGIFLQGFISGILGIIAGLIVLKLLKNEELENLIDTLRTKFWRAKIIAPPTDTL